MGAADCTENSPELSARVLQVCRDRLGLSCVEMKGGASGSEDYSYFSERVRSQGGQSCYFSTSCAAPARSTTASSTSTRSVWSTGSSPSSDDL